MNTIRYICTFVVVPFSSSLLNSDRMPRRHVLSILTNIFHIAKSRLRHGDKSMARRLQTAKHTLTGSGGELS
jgi:hypothetical protein